MKPTVHSKFGKGISDIKPGILDSSLKFGITSKKIWPTSTIFLCQGHGSNWKTGKAKFQLLKKTTAQIVCQLLLAYLFVRRIDKVCWLLIGVKVLHRGDGGLWFWLFGQHGSSHNDAQSSPLEVAESSPLWHQLTIDKVCWLSRQKGIGSSPDPFRSGCL